MTNIFMVTLMTLMLTCAGIFGCGASEAHRAETEATQTANMLINDALDCTLAMENKMSPDPALWHPKYMAIYEMGLGYLLNAQVGGLEHMEFVLWHQYQIGAQSLVDLATIRLVLCNAPRDLPLPDARDVLIARIGECAESLSYVPFPPMQYDEWTMQERVMYRAMRYLASNGGVALKHQLYESFGHDEEDWEALQHTHEIACSQGDWMQGERNQA